MSLILTPEEIVELTGGLAQPARQLERLKELGFWRARVDRGRLILERAHYEAVCAIREKAPHEIAPPADLRGLTKTQLIILGRPFAGICGVYFLIKGSEVVYVGQSSNVFTRVAQHLSNKVDFDRWHFIPCKASELLDLETHYIETFRPALNRRKGE